MTFFMSIPPTTIDETLLEAMRKFPRVTIPQGTRVFHGTFVNRHHADDLDSGREKNRLLGTRKFVVRIPEIVNTDSGRS